MLQKVRYESAWEAWIEFFLKGVQQTAQQAFNTARQLVDLFGRDRRLIESGAAASSGSILHVHDYLQRHVFLNVPEAQQVLPISAPTIRSALRSLEGLGIIREITGKRRDQVWVYSEYLDILNKGISGADGLKH